MASPKKNLILATLNSSYFHTAFGLRYIFANLGLHQEHAALLEFTTQQNIRDVAEQILQYNPSIVGLGVYIWNTTQTQELVSILKSVQPELCIVIGGPEVSYEQKNQAIIALSDHVLCGEADLSFHRFIENFGKPQPKILPSELPDLSKMELPYRYYSDEDLKNRVLYVEASRGCPYKCEFCLSSLDESVRTFHLDRFLNEMQCLIDRGARSFKFVDRTFNLNYKTSQRILQFFLDRVSMGLFIHFELVPDRLPQELKTLICQFPKGSLQFEVGIQTWNKKVARLVSRNQDFEKTAANLQFLRNETKAHLHTDLIAGLPGEDLASFAKGFDQLYDLNPHEIQVGILKRLKGTPIVRHDLSNQMIYQSMPPFSILKNKDLSFIEVLNLQRFAKFWDLYGNSGHFKRSMKLLFRLSKQREDRSFFWEFWNFTLFLNRRHPERHSLALLSLVESLWFYLTENRKQDASEVRSTLIEDYTGDISRDIPKFLRTEECSPKPTKLLKSSLPKRQALHLGRI